MGFSSTHRSSALARCLTGGSSAPPHTLQNPSLRPKVFPHFSFPKFSLSERLWKGHSPASATHTPLLAGSPSGCWPPALPSLSALCPLWALQRSLPSQPAPRSARCCCTCTRAGLTSSLQSHRPAENHRFPFPTPLTGRQTAQPAHKGRGSALVCRGRTQLFVLKAR